MHTSNIIHINIIHANITHINTPTTDQNKKFPIEVLKLMYIHEL